LIACQKARFFIHPQIIDFAEKNCIIWLTEVNMAEVRRARDADVRGILNLVKRVHVKNLARLEDGFLMIPNASPVLYQFWFNVSPYCYAAVSGSKVIGILVALPGHVLDQRNEFYLHIREAFAGEKILFVVQVAVSPDFRGQGVGRAMCGRLFEEAGDAIILSSSMTAPYYNGASERFHLAVGFQKMGEMEASDKSRCYLYLRKNDQEKGCRRRQ